MSDQDSKVLGEETFLKLLNNLILDDAVNSSFQKLESHPKRSQSF
jgi:hypothetical protein